MIAFESVTAFRGPTRALHEVSFRLERGQMAALVGRSGSGKSTVLKLVLRLLDPRSGAVQVDDRDTRAWDPIALRRHTGYVLQEVGLFPHMTVEENVQVVPKLLGWPGPRRTRRTREMLELVGLDPATFAARWPHELSGGQRQRVGVARALAADPPLLLMDEPFGALDPITRADMQREFRRIRSRIGTTIVMVTHDMREAFALADRVGVLEQGRLAAWDEPEALKGSTEPAVRDLLACL